MGMSGGMSNGMPQPRMASPRNMIPPRTQYLPGRFIMSEEEISPGEIPMDNSISFFCYNDLSKIVIKQWNNRGLLDTATYSMDIPAQTQINSAQQPDPVSEAVSAQPQTQSVPEQLPPDQLQEFQATLQNFTQTVENAFNNLAANIQQGMQSINNKLENLDHGQG